MSRTSVIKLHALAVLVVLATCSKDDTPGCPKPSAQNLLTNAGFDTNVDNMCLFGGLQWTNEDADSCSSSGSAMAATPSGCPTQCVSVKPGTTYTFGGVFKSTKGRYVCYASAWKGPGCGTEDVTAGTLGLLEGTEASWTRHQVQWQMPAQAESLRINCEAPEGTHFDKLFLSPSPGDF